MADRIGYLWLTSEFGVDPVQPFPVDSQIGKGRATVINNGAKHEIYPQSMRPDATLASHLAFALKREGIHLEFLARLFATISDTEIEEWVNREPSGQYARRIGFFYEWLTGKRLNFPGVTVGNYVSALPEEDYLTSLSPSNNPRWRVRDNLAGTPHFCPMVRRTPGVKELEIYDCNEKLQEIEAEFGADILMRSSVWLTLKESRASFAIEHEESQVDRIKRFASALETRSGTSEDPFSNGFLEDLQADILGKTALRVGLRRSPVFVGETGLGREIVHYVAPHWDQVPGMLDGLHIFDQSTVGRSSLLRTAVLSFGFVYVHPMVDGNGRISRFLINDCLRRDGATPEPFILPVSATITRTGANRAAYDRVLEVFSKPFMSRYSDSCTFGTSMKAEDGIWTNFNFSSYEDARWAWQFVDLTSHTEYLGGVIRETIESEMRMEASYLLEHRLMRERIKNVMEAPDVEVDRIIRSVRDNHGSVSNKLVKEFPLLGDPETASAIVNAVTQARP